MKNLVAEIQRRGSLLFNVISALITAVRMVIY